MLVVDEELQPIQPGMARLFDWPAPRYFQRSARILLLLLQALVVTRAAAPLSNHPGANSFQHNMVRLPVVERQDLRYVPLTVAGEPFKQSADSLVQDKFGRLWFGAGGLYRYNGYELKAYRHDRGDPRSLIDDAVRRIYPDRSGILWIATARGLDRFDPITESFTHFRHDAGDRGSLGGDEVGCVYRDRNGTLWVTAGGLNRLDPGSKSFKHFSHNPRDPGSLSSNDIASILEDQAGNLWVGSAAGLNRLDRRTGRASLYLPDPAAPAGSPHNFISAIVQDHTGVLWVGTGIGLSSLDVGTGRFKNYPIHPEELDSRTDAGVTALLEDRNGTLWAGTVNKGLFMLGRERKEFVRCPNGLLPGSSEIESLYEDAEGEIWVGARGGLSHFLEQESPFVSYKHEPTNPDSLRDNMIWSVHGDSQGSLWIGTEAGLDRLDRKTRRFTRYQHNPKDPASLSYDTVSAIREDRQGVLWFGAYGGGLNRFDRATQRFVAYRHQPNDPNSLSSDLVLSLFLDRQGVIWVGTNGGGLNRFDPASGRFETFRNVPGNAHTLSDDNVKVVFEDAAGVLWVGTNSGGLNRFDRSTGQFTAYRYDPKDPGSLSSDKVNAIWEDRHGTLWVGTADGLNRMDRSRGTFTSSDISGGVDGILEDGHGYLWLATHSGLARFLPTTKGILNYTESDGLAGNNLDPYGTEGSYEGPDGEMVFGSTNGITTFYPDRLAANPYVPPVVLTDFLLFNKPLAPGPDSPLREPIWAARSITLHDKQNIFSVEFAALSYVAPEKNRYRYRLEGLEKDWNEVGADRRVVSYNSLPPSKYLLRVQGSNNDLVWNETGVRLEITVLPPWWGTWWFRSAAFLGVACLAFLAYQWRTRSLRLAAQRLELQVDQRTRELRLARDAADSANRAKSAFLANMSHELRTPLNSILGFSTLLREGRVSEEQQQKDLETINRSGHHLLGLINNVLDLAKVESGRTDLHLEPCDLKNLVTEITEMIRVRANEKNVALRVVVDPDSPRAVRADGEKLRQVLINLLGNAVKFTEKGSVTLTVNSRTAEDGQPLVLIFEVEDTGIGIAADDQARIFDAFVQAGQSRTHKGTGLGLTISRQFVKLMGGDIEVASTPGHGSRFRVELPAEPTQAPELPQPETEECKIIGVELDRPDYRVLIVDDVEENRLVLQRLMESAGFQVRCGENGAQGVEMFQSWRPHFIWMDLRMPLMDGKEAVLRIRDLDGGRNTKIAAVTASAFASERDDIMAAGVDDFIRKPYQPSEIFDCMARHLGLRRVLMRSPKEQRRVPLSKEGLEALPRELVGELHSEIVRLDNKRIQGVIARISQYDPAVGQQLTHMAASFAYTAMLEAVQPEGDESLGASTVEQA